MQELVNYFSIKNKFKESELLFTNLLIFCAKYKVPWILKWFYHINWDSRALSRQFSVKWWDKFKIDKTVDYVHSYFPLVIVPPQSSQKPSSSGSSLVSFSAEGKSKAELQEIARQLIIQASQMEDNDDTASPRSQSSTSQPHQSSSQKTSQKDSTPKLQWADDEDSQDPYDLNSD
ncbi:hypothetical protein L3X38_031907 [Prunus dulcis]|uniref:Uncharacterized protein n=1 Tax=Prunus dulcis TaxID=3755 RepID=A0AAD4VD21_PRUDU|nr:hypothetical protein L3X38_031907 [Prunus dulcis]